MAVDVSGRMEIENSPRRLVWLSLLGVLTTTLCAALALGYLGTAGIVAVVIGWIGAVFFGLCTLVAFRRAFSSDGPAIVLSPQGFFDPRVSPDVVPWQAVDRVFEWSMQGQKMVIVSVDPQYEQHMNLSRMARMSRKANAALGADGLPLTAHGTKVSHDGLMGAVTAYVHAHGRPAS